MAVQYLSRSEHDLGRTPPRAAIDFRRLRERGLDITANRRTRADDSHLRSNDRLNPRERQPLPRTATGPRSRTTFARPTAALISYRRPWRFGLSAREAQLRSNPTGSPQRASRRQWSRPDQLFGVTPGYKWNSPPTTAPTQFVRELRLPPMDLGRFVSINDFPPTSTRGKGAGDWENIRIGITPRTRRERNSGHFRALRMRSAPLTKPTRGFGYFATPPNLSIHHHTASNCRAESPPRCTSRSARSRSFV